MYGKRKWNKVPGDSQFDAYWAEGWRYEHNDDLLPDLVQRELARAPRDDVVTFTVDWLSSGYSDPGVSSGPVERCYPPECDDERVLADVVTVEVGGVTAKLSREASLELFNDALESIILKTEPEPEEYSGGPWDESYFNKALNKILLS